MKIELLICAAAAATFVATAASAQSTDAGKRAMSKMGAEQPIKADSVKWGRTPRELVHGKPAEEFHNQAPVEFAVLSGDPAKAGAPYTVRLKCPDGVRMPPHRHPRIEHVTVLQGTLVLAQGDKWDQTKGDALGAGSYMVIPANAPHFGWCKGETIIQAHGVGPFHIDFGPMAEKGAVKRTK
jgi:quercetin dioxygenase-like cupin family protein